MKSMRTKEIIKWWEKQGWIYGNPENVEGSFIAIVYGYPWPVMAIVNTNKKIVYTTLQAETDGSDYLFENETCELSEIVFYKKYKNYPNKQKNVKNV